MGSFKTTTTSSTDVEEPQDPPTKTNEKVKCWWKPFLILFILIALGGILAGVVVVVLATECDEDEYKKPVGFPNDLPNSLVKRLISISGEEVFGSTDSPQHRAIHLLSDNADILLDDKPSDRVWAERYILTLFYLVAAGAQESDLHISEDHANTGLFFSGADHCKWQDDSRASSGIHCNERGHVTRINLERTDLPAANGGLIQELSHLQDLVELKINKMSLGGTIPSELAQLRELQKLNMNSCSLAGSIPPSLAQLDELQELILTSNALTGSIPPQVTQMVHLTKLDLSYNQITGTIPETIGELSNMIKLYLDQNALTGTLPNTMGNMAYLWVFDVSSNKLHGTIPDSLALVQELNVPRFRRDLYLQDNDFTDDLNVPFCNTTRYMYLQVDCDPAMICDCCNRFLPNGVNGQWDNCTQT